MSTHTPSHKYKSGHCIKHQGHIQPVALLNGDTDIGAGSDSLKSSQFGETDQISGVRASNLHDISDRL